MVRSTHNAGNSAAHGVRLTQQILLHYGRNRNARESVSGKGGVIKSVVTTPPVFEARQEGT